VPTGELSINARWAEMIGYTLEELTPSSFDTTWVRVVHPEDKKTSDALLKEHFEGKTPYYECEVRLRHKDGQWIWILARAKVVEWTRDGQPWLIAGINHDITQRKHIEEQIRHMANHDGLTNLPSLRLAKDRLAVALKTARRQQSIAAVMFIDLDGFKAVNDTYGHDIGDLTLKQVAQRLQACVREVDTVARIGGDEFLFIATGLRDRDNAAMIAEKIIQSVTQPVAFNGHQTSVGASIGIALFPPECNDIDHMIKLADQAMYVAKHSRGKKYIFADSAEFFASQLDSLADP
jgi:diguanylate cyclase (GGDEF)-like protein/PAS domain S-box-containing protein